MRLPLALTAIAVVTLGCRSPEPTGIPHLVDGSDIHSRAAAVGESFIIVADPHDMFSCYSAIPGWLDASRRGLATVRFVLARAPTSDERRQLTLERIHISGILATQRENDLIQQYRFADGHLMAVEQISNGLLWPPMLEHVYSRPGGPPPRQAK